MDFWTINSIKIENVITEMKVCFIPLPRTQAASHHQGYMFRMGNPKINLHLWLECRVGGKSNIIIPKESWWHQCIHFPFNLLRVFFGVSHDQLRWRNVCHLQGGHRNTELLQFLFTVYYMGLSWLNWSNGDENWRAWHDRPSPKMSQKCLCL